VDRRGLWKLVLALLAFGSANANDSDAPATHTVTIANMKFEPAELIVKRGERVIWINKDLVAHTATATTFDSSNIGPNASWTLVTLKSGEQTYVCSLHPTIKARLIVR